MTKQSEVGIRHTITYLTMFKGYSHFNKLLPIYVNIISIVATCILVSAEVLAESIDYEHDNLPARHPGGAYFTFGYSYFLAWIVFGIFVVTGVIFLLLSGKRKGEAAYTESEALENEPVHLGRL